MMESKNYQFKVYATPVTFPLSLALHTWIFVQSPENGSHRYEVFCFKNPQTDNYFYINAHEERDGMSVFGLLNYISSRWRFTSRCLYEVDGDEAKEKVLELQKIIGKYPYLDTYIVYPGPNSNTFTQWVLDACHVPLTLPWNAFGKNYLHK